MCIHACVSVCIHVRKYKMYMYTLCKRMAIATITDADI